MEHAVYDPESGQLLAGSFMDYALPRADDLPSFDLTLAGEPCTTNPLGVKGAGEAGAIAGYPAVANAILDALKPYGITALEGPATPETIWRLVQRGQPDQVRARSS
jgi:carbon-monoxide dehydrogenase large subunit